MQKGVATAINFYEISSTFCSDLPALHKRMHKLYTNTDCTLRATNVNARLREITRSLVYIWIPQNWSAHHSTGIIQDTSPDLTYGTARNTYLNAPIFPSCEEFSWASAATPYAGPVVCHLLISDTLQQVLVSAYKKKRRQRLSRFETTSTAEANGNCSQPVPYYAP